MDLTPKEAKEFVHWIIAQLDNEGHYYSYWIERFLKEVVEPQTKEKMGIIQIGGEPVPRKCFGLYNPTVKICPSLCSIRVQCQLVSKNGFKRCLECARIALPDKKYCYYHYSIRNKAGRGKTERQIAQGLCIQCGKKNDSLELPERRNGHPLRRCSKCREKIKLQKLIEKTNGAFIHPSLVNKVV